MPSQEAAAEFLGSLLRSPALTIVLILAFIFLPSWPLSRSGA